jgi:hypothetical protein
LFVLWWSDGKDWVAGGGIIINVENFSQSSHMMPMSGMPSTESLVISSGISHFAAILRLAVLVSTISRQIPPSPSFTCGNSFEIFS